MLRLPKLSFTPFCVVIFVLLVSFFNCLGRDGFEELDELIKEHELKEDKSALLKYYLRYYELADSLQNQEAFNYANVKLGVYYSRLGEFDKMNSYFDKIKGGEAENHKQYYLLQTQGQLIWEKGDTDTAIELLLIATQKAIENQDIHASMNLKTTVGYLYAKKGDLEKGLEYFEECKQYGLSNKDTFHLIVSYENIGCTYREMEKFEEAYMYFDSSIYYADLVGNDRGRFNAFLNKSWAYERQGDYKNALLSFREHFKSYRKVFNNEKASDISQLEIKFDTEQKEKELAFQKQNNRILFLLFLMGVIFTILYIRNTSKDKKKSDELRKLTEVNLRLKQRELEHSKIDITAMGIDIKRRNQFSDLLQQKILKIGNSKVEGLEEIKKMIGNHVTANKSLSIFQENVSIINSAFEANLKSRFPSLTSSEVQLCGLLKLGFSNQQIADNKDITIASARTFRYKIRKKLGLGKEDDVTEFLKGL